jgi:ribosomal protein S18 acetylase RimI-like enzyme
MTSYSLQPASNYSIPQLADLITRGFEGYFISVELDASALFEMIRRNGIDLLESRVILADGEAVGLALIARRGWTSRLAAMGIVASARNGGVGTWVMERLIEDARARGEKEMVLEVIQQNTAGVKLYQKVGFKTVRILFGYKLEKPQVESTETLQELDIRDYAHLVTLHGLSDLPWQASGETASQFTPPSKAYRLGDAYCFISNPSAEHVAISSLLVLPDGRSRGQAVRLLHAVFAAFPDKVWHVSAICPEDVGFVFEKAGMKREELSQFQMDLKL